MSGRHEAGDLARQIGLYDGPDLQQQPHSGISAPHLTPSMPRHPQQPLSAPHPSLGLAHDAFVGAVLATPERHVGSRYTANPTREAIAQLIEGTEAKGAHAHSSAVSVNSLPSQNSVASFDPSTVTNERSWDSAGSYSIRPTSAASGRSSGRSGAGSAAGGVLFSQHSDSADMYASQGAVRAQGCGNDEVLREQLPLELRSFGAPPEYAEVMRSPPTSQPNSGVHLGADRYRRAEAAGQPAAYNSPVHQPAPLSHGEDPALAAIMQTASALTAASAPSSSRDLHLDVGGGVAESPGSRGRSVVDSEFGHGESLAVGGGDDSESQKRNVLSEAVIRKLKVKNQSLEKEVRDKKKQVEEMTKSVVSWKKSIKDRHDKKIEQVVAHPESVCALNLVARGQHQDTAGKKKWQKKEEQCAAAGSRQRCAHRAKGQGRGGKIEREVSECVSERPKERQTQTD